MFIYKIHFALCWSVFEKCSGRMVTRTHTHTETQFMCFICTWQNPSSSFTCQQPRARPAVSISVYVNIYTSCWRKTISYTHISLFTFWIKVDNVIFLVLTHKSLIDGRFYSFFFTFISFFYFFQSFFIFVCCNVFIHIDRSFCCFILHKLYYTNWTFLERYTTEMR